MPVLITKSPYFNFLREYWLACHLEDKSAKALVTEASLAWQNLEANEKSLYEEVRGRRLLWLTYLFLNSFTPTSRLPI